MVKRSDPSDITHRNVEEGTDNRRKLSGSAVGGMIIAGWTLLVVGSFLLDDTMTPRFFDLPLGAFLAGQGALMGLVLVGMRVTRTDLNDSR